MKNLNNKMIMPMLITALLLSGLVTGQATAQVSGRVIVAKSGGDYTTISAALAAISPTASNPYLIDVMPGTYIENVTMKSYVHLRGAGRDVTTIQGASTSSPVVHIYWLTDVSVSGFTIKGIGSHNGIRNDGSSPTISKNRITGASSGIVNDNDASPLISENLITGNSYGVFTQGPGAYQTSSAKPKIIGNTITGNSVDGVTNTYGASPIIVGNTINANTGKGINNSNGGEISVIGNTIVGNGSHGIAASSDWLTITGNRITDNGGSGIYSQNSEILISGNTIRANANGISDSQSILTVSANAIVLNTGYGIYLIASPGGSTFSGNTITGNSYDGINMVNSSPSSSPKILNNRITGNGASYVDIRVGSNTPHISFNVYDSISGSGVGHYNLKSDGTTWP